MSSPRSRYPHSLPWAAASPEAGSGILHRPGAAQLGPSPPSLVPRDLRPPTNPLSPGNLGCIKALHTSFGREACSGCLSRLALPPIPLSCFSCLRPAKGHVPSETLSSLSASISQTGLCYFPEPSPPCLPRPGPPRGFYGHCRGQETAHGFLQLCTGCRSARAEAGGQQTGIGSAESPGPSASARFFQREHHGRRTGPPAALTPHGGGV